MLAIACSLCPARGVTALVDLLQHRTTGQESAVRWLVGAPELRQGDRTRRVRDELLRLTGSDDTDRIAADLAQDSDLSPDERCRIVAEMGEWYFARPVQERFTTVTGCA